MSASGQPDEPLFSEIHALVSECLFGRDTSESRARLEALLEQSAEARQLYFQYQLDTTLIRVVGCGGGDAGDEANACSRTGEGDKPLQLSPPVVPVRTAGLQGPRLHLAAILAASLVVSGAVLLLKFSLFSGGDQEFELAGGEPSVMGQARIDSKGAASEEAEKRPAVEQFVARVVKAGPGAEWDTRFAPNDFLLRLKAAETIVLEVGVVEIEFYSRARVVLQAPAVFTPLGIDRARLKSGMLTGSVSEGDFHLEAGIADVIDLGTKFGVSVGADSGADIIVFDGEVDVRATQGYQQHSLRLKAGMSAQVLNDGSMHSYSKVEPHEFVSVEDDIDARPNGPLRTLSLIDIVAGGDGVGRRLSGAIDPISGGWDRRIYRDAENRNIDGDGAYHPCEISTWIDGVFVPDSNQRQLTISSDGRSIEIPTTSGFSYGPIWVRRRPLSATWQANPVDFWATGTLPHISEKLEEATTGVMGLHSNVGITFDLSQVMAAGQGEAVRFRAVLANLDNAKDYMPEVAEELKQRSADVRILLDGEELYRRLNFTRDDGEELADVKLDGGRFLTIISTDGGDGNFFDHVVLIDPVLVLEQVEGI